MDFNETQHPRAPAGTSEGGQFTSKNRTFIASSTPDATLKVLSKHYLGKELDREGFAEITGAPPESKVRIHAGDTLINVTIGIMKDGKEIGNMFRVVDLPNKAIKNEAFDLDPNEKGGGIGTRALVQQMRTASAAGFIKIETYANGIGSSLRERSIKSPNGYYTWLRLGFMPDTRVVFTGGGTGSGSTRGLNPIKLMSTPEGRKYWKEKGTSFQGTFDLTEGSTSRRVLEGYAKAKGI
jgi:hypothetical protein